MSLNRTQIVDWLYRCGDIFTKESDFLTGLDKEIGDADHEEREEWVRDDADAKRLDGVDGWQLVWWGFEGEE